MLADRQTDRQTQSSQYSAPLSERSDYRLLKLIRSCSVLSNTVGHRHMQLHSQPKRTYDTYVMHAYDIYFTVHTLYKNNNCVLCLLCRLSTRRCPQLLLSSGACSTAHAVIDRYLLPARRSAQQLTRRTPLQLSIDGTDRRTDARSLHRPCFAYYASSVNYSRPRRIRKLNSSKFIEFNNQTTTSLKGVGIRD